ncbi:hypothetical protein GGR50DRAFT_696312 [Xylaria sp. CBS 124048]|nr:hypothetical protein GGR50DRAFT_696312 [Xylaria sp. CBS 124048]
MPRMPRFSPYGPRPRRSARLIFGWFLILVLILALTLYLTSRDGEPSKVDTKYVVDKLTGRQGAMREKTSKILDTYLYGPELTFPMSRHQRGLGSLKPCNADASPPFG